MTLKLYMTPRMVILSQQTPAIDAARAMENNRIGAVIVQNKGRIVGIVTDRDLSIRVIGQNRDPQTTSLAEIMTKPVVTLSTKNTHEDAIRLMKEQNVRRIPLVDDERLVGIVTLDDLILDEAAPIDEVAAIVATQVGEGGPATSARTPAKKRSAARAQATYRRLVQEVQNETHLGSYEQAEAALETTLSSLVRRLTPAEAKDLTSQLPSLLRRKLKNLSLGPDRQVTRESIEAELIKVLDVETFRAREILSSIGEVIAQNISPGELSDIQSQLPKHLREIFSTEIRK